MTSIALERVNTATGEVATLVEFNMSDYLASVSTHAAIETQKKLAAAYDKACDALIGANDVQVEGNRSFKKKSAWRKLARHFNISTDVLKVDREYLNGYFLATVTVRARAPWGQSAEAVGACCTDEATGRRVITIADAIATAETRATNRCVSNLIAMGEVSAEEMSGKGEGEQRRNPTTASTTAKTSSTTSSTIDDVSCPNCGSANMFDNRAENAKRVAQGLKARPDFKCKDTNCGGVIWPKDGVTAKASVRGAAMDADHYEPPSAPSGPLVDETFLPF